MTYNIIHRTIYEYAAPVTMSHHVARLEPRATSTQAQENFSLKIFPEPTLRKARTDYFGNRICLFSVQEVHSKLEIITHSRVAVSAKKIAVPEITVAWEQVAKLFRDPVSPEVVESC
jgi:transglutaminase-like putative cysteine protease